MDDLDKELLARAEALTLRLFPDARRDGPELRVDDKVQVFLAGNTARIFIEGNERGPRELLMFARPTLRGEDVDSWLANWLADEQAEEAELEPEQPEPEEMHALTITRPARGAGIVALPTKAQEGTHRLFPQSEMAEKGVLSSFLQAPREIGALCRAKGLYTGHFHLPANALIFEWLQRLHEDNEPIDIITLTKKLHDLHLLDDARGAAYISELFTFLPTAANAENYIKILQEKYALREAIKVCSQYSTKFFDEQDNVWQLLDLAHKEMANVAELAAGRASRLPELRDLSTMLGANKPARPPELVHGLLHQGSKLIIGGTSKGRKTFSLLDLAISVSTGTPWWGMPTVQGKVCYINFEIQEPFFCQRIEDICKAKGINLAPGMLMGWTLRGHSEGIEKMVAELMRVLLDGRFTLIIFDPIYKALGDRDENKAGDVASLCNELERIAVKTGAAIAFGAHYSKGNQAEKESIDRIGGSGVFARDPDAILTMTAHEQEECFTVDTTLRNFAPMAPFVVKWAWPLFTRDNTADPAALKPRKAPGKPFEPTYTHDMILQELSMLEGVAPAHLQKRVATETGMGRATYFRFLNELKGLKKIEKKADGKFYLKGRSL